MNKKTLIFILAIISAVGGLAELLTWLGVTPSHITNNGLISSFMNILNFQIPIFLVSFIVLITILLYKTANKYPKILSTPNIAKEPKKEEVAPDLSQEQKLLLLWLLERSDKSYLRHKIEYEYKFKFNKTTADFNIVEDQLYNLDLIRIRSSAGGRYWELSEKGLKIAAIIHSEVNK